MKLFIDDERNPPDNSWLVARSTDEAVRMCQAVWPSDLALDHDLGGDDRIMDFLKILHEMGEGRPMPSWTVHSANPVGRKNIESFMNSWERSLREEPC